MATPQEALAAAYGSWNAGDLDGYLSLYDEGIALHGYSPEPMNKDQVRSFHQGIFSAFGTPKLEFHEVLWDGDVAAIRFTMTGRHVDEFMGVPASGTAIALPGITILHFRGDRVIERFSQADMLGLLIPAAGLIRRVVVWASGLPADREPSAGAYSPSVVVSRWRARFDRRYRSAGRREPVGARQSASDRAAGAGSDPAHPVRGMGARPVHGAHRRPRDRRR